MDLFTGAVGSGLGQVHDFNPGIRAGGLFWTIPVHEHALNVDIADGTATLALNDLDQEDYHNLHNALLDGPSDPATVNFSMKWTANGAPMNVTDSVHRFTGRFMLSAVEIAWSATTPTFSFVSDPPGTTQNVQSVMGRERNGVFFDE
jgi:hypothetical protein